MRFMLLTVFFVSSLCSAPLYLIDSVPNIEGNELILRNDSTALEVVSSYSYTDSAYLLMKRAEIAFNSEEFGSAKRYLRRVAEESEAFAPFAFRRIGDIELAQGEISYSIVSYRTAAELTSLMPYRFMLNELVDSLGTEYQDELSATGWHTLLFPDIVVETVKDTLLPQLKERLKLGVTEQQFDSLLAVAEKNNLASSLKSSLRDTSLIREPFSTKRRYEHSRYLNKLKAYSDASRWMHSALNQSDFTKEVSQKAYLRDRAMLNYSLKNWSNCVKWSKDYFKKYGHTAELIYYTARAYRKMGMSDKADYWYAEHIRRYPQLKRSHDILWYQAWQFEDRGSFDTAIVRFKSVSEKFPSKKYGDDAGFRVGLLYFRTGQYSKAVSAFDTFLKNFPKSNLVPGAYYWKGRCYAQLKKETESKSAFTKVTNDWPLDYFAWRSRQFLGTVDSFEISTVPFDTWYDSLKSLSTEVNDTLASYNADSLFTLATQLGTIGYRDEAMLLLEPFEVRGYRNYAQLFELSKLYDIIGEHYNAFKMSKKIFYALPGSLRKSLPVEYLTRLYPEAYPLEVEYASERMDVNPHLVRAIMRQESMFSSSIKSWVGATGLMQIMPYTGEEIAQDLDTTYHDKMLLDPSVNVTFGTYYIGKLLKQFEYDQVKAIASYNGGPHNVKKWVKRSKDVLHDSPFFSECIGFSETRHYVKMVLENLWIYEKLEKQNITSPDSAEKVVPASAVEKSETVVGTVTMK